MPFLPPFFAISKGGPLRLFIILWNMSAFTAVGEPLPKGSLSGTIVDSDGKPVSGARVWVNTWGDKRLAEARSDATGRFRLGPVEPVYRHPWPIVIEAVGFAPQCVWGNPIQYFLVSIAVWVRFESIRAGYSPVRFSMWTASRAATPR